MHGRNRAEYNAKVSSPDFTRALTKKVSNYAALVNACSSRKKKKVYDMETLGLIGTVLTINPDYATFWNYRREIVTAGGAGDWVSESEITNKCLTKNPKSYPSWFHRKWSFLHFPTSPISSEITLTTTFLKLDSRNFHCWNYRRFLISQQIGVDSATGEIKDLLIKSGFGCQLLNQRTKINKNVEFNQESCLSILLSEFEYTLELIKTNFSNYSAYHYRSHLLPLIHLLQTLDSESESEGYFRKLAVVKKELELVQQAIFTEPSDQSSWWYQQFLFKYIVPPKNDKMSEEKKRYAETLQEETEPLRELIAEEMKEGVSGGAKWALNSLWGILETLDEMVGMGLGEDADQVLEVLLMGDEGGRERYGGLKREKEARNTKVREIIWVWNDEH
ncbi:hypothetical protein TL16_g05294 [Triparma laevis f. inornata]|uniref:Geranylgeranyl transferase type-2 subunit alpha n=2 Tax=Triparma laevis TaxID=1534972 RepID=A0A9W7DR15_9STRA|nr:hypothetical protein TrLO_g7444 [Triparma laevis f. longispina]GMH69980.1 hypothetical protein TL16_g05294 [Triparma laevis f. inornata]